MGADLPDIFLDRFHLFREIDRKGLIQGPVYAEFLFADPGKGEERDIFETVFGGINVVLGLGYGSTCSFG